jgi:quercetin dioxygenase-like cupin family protein
MPIEVRRFGVGHRRPEGPPGTTGLEGQVIHSDARGVISELVFKKGGRIEPHSNPNTTWFCVIEGGGWSSVGDEVIRIAAGEAVRWPAGELHAAWTDLLPMRALVIEFAGPDDGWAREIIGGLAQAALATGATPVSRGEGRLAERASALEPGHDSEGEPA